MPPLRERRDDFGRLFFHFLREELRGHRRGAPPAPPRGRGQPWLPASVVARLARYAWPGNMRQLRNAVRQIVIASRSSDTVQIGPQVERLLREAEATLPASPRGRSAPAAPLEPAPRRRARRRRSTARPSEVTEAEVLDALRDQPLGGQAAAEQLGISRPSLYLLMEKSLASARRRTSPEEILAAREQCGGDLDAMVTLLEVSKKGLQQRINQLGIG